MKPFVMLELDRPRKLRFGMNALVVIEELIGKNISEMNLEKVSMKDIRTIIYAGLSGDNKTLLGGVMTPEMVGDLIDEYSDINTVALKMSEAFEHSFGKNVVGPVVEKENGSGESV